MLKRQTDRQTDRHTDTHTDTHTHAYVDAYMCAHAPTQKQKPAFLERAHQLTAPLDSAGSDWNEALARSELLASSTLHILLPEYTPYAIVVLSQLYCIRWPMSTYHAKCTMCYVLLLHYAKQEKAARVAHSACGSS